MRTEKEIKDKISELITNFLVDSDNKNILSTLRDMKRTIKLLNWVLGKEWINNRIPAKHGGKGLK